MLDCYCDYEPADFYRKSTPRARKQYRCDECFGMIGIGEQYEYIAGKWGGDFGVVRTCKRCSDLRQWVQNNIPCFCGAYGNVRDDARNAIEDATWRAPDETVGLRFGLLRRLVAIDKHNRERR